MLVGSVGQLMRGAVAGSTVMYLGGAFSGANSVRASTRNRAAAVDADVSADTDAMVEAWDPNCNSTVYSMVLNGSDMYIGGDFTTISGSGRNYAACVDSDVTQANPTLRAWNPNCDRYILTMVLSGSDMYLGGFFTQVRGTARNYAACVDSDPTAANPTLRAWNPNCNNTLQGMVLNGSDMYLCGDFTLVRGTARNRAACVDSNVMQANPPLRAWNPNCVGSVYEMVLNGSDMYLGGPFTQVRGTARNRAACVDSDVTQANPTLRAWDPNCNGTVYSMILSGSDMYLGGLFTTISGSGRNYAACVDSDVTQANPTLRAWDPNCGNLVYEMVLNGSDMYLCGFFQTVGGIARNRAACVDSDPTAANPTLRAWDPIISFYPQTMVLA